MSEKKNWDGIKKFSSQSLSTMSVPAVPGLSCSCGFMISFGTTAVILLLSECYDALDQEDQRIRDTAVIVHVYTDALIYTSGGMSLL